MNGKLKKELREALAKEIRVYNSQESTKEEKRDAFARMSQINQILSELSKNDNSNTFQYLKLGVDLLAIVGPLSFYWIWMNRGLKYEETGTCSSWIFKGLMNKAKLTK